MNKKIYESDKLSCVICGVDKENRKTLFNFPSSQERKEKWMAILNIKSLKRRSRLCQRHFSNDQFVHTRLKKGALPQLLTSRPGPVYQEGYIEILPKPVLPFSCQFDRLPLTPLNVLNCDAVGENPNVTSVRTFRNEEIRPILISPSILDPMVPVPECSSSIGNREAIATPHRSQSTETQIHSKCRQKLQKLKFRTRKLQKTLKERIDLKKTFAKCPQFYAFIEGQINRYKNTSKVYTAFEKSMSLSLYYACGKNGYSLLKSLGMRLPTIRTLRKWMEDFNFLPGINEELFLALKEATMSFSSRDKDCVLTLDEMAIKELLEYNRATDKLDGLVELGLPATEKSLEPANEALVFMVQGINSKWKFPVSYYFSNHATKAEHLDILVNQTIAKLSEIGLNVRMCICDMAFTNQSLYKRWEVTPHKPFKKFQEKKVYCIHDTPHLIKLVRNNLIKYDFVHKKRVGNRIVSSKIRWLHISNFFNKDRRLTSRMAPKLTTAHIYLKDFSKMKVKLATQVLSNSVFAGIMALVNLRLLKKDAEETAKFVKSMNDLFDLVNISKYDEDKPSRCSKFLFENFDRFDKHINFIRSIEIPKYPHEPEFLKGLGLSLMGIKLLCSDLKREGYTHVYTRQLQQDCLEHFFSAIRMKGGFCRNPTARQFRTNFKYLFLAKLLKIPLTGNTEGNHHNSSIILKSIKKLKLSNSHGMESDTLATSSGTMVNCGNDRKNIITKKTRKLKFGDEQEQSVLSYFGPACIYSVNEKINCDRCSELINRDGASKTEMLVHYRQEGTHNLATMRNDVEAVFLFLNKNFDTYANHAFKMGGSNLARYILESYLRDKVITKWLADECKSHRLEIMKYYIRAKLYRLVKDKNESYKKVKSWNQTRRDLRNQ